MNEEELIDGLLSALGRERRGEAPGDPEWEAVIHGGRDAEALADARIAAGDSPDLTREREILYRPLSTSEREDLIKGALAASSGAEMAEPLRREPRGRSLAPALTVFTALAAGLILWLLVPATMAHYTLEADDGYSDFRGESDPGSSLRRYRPDTIFTWTLKPETSNSGAVEVGVFAFADGEPTAAGARLNTGSLVEIDPQSGAVKLSGEFSALGLEPGRWVLVLVVARALAMPKDPLGAWEAEDGRNLQVELLEIEVDG